MPLVQKWSDDTIAFTEFACFHSVPWKFSIITAQNVPASVTLFFKQSHMRQSKHRPDAKEKKEPTKKHVKTQPSPFVFTMKPQK
jgi:hypothetical protein